MSLPHYIDLAHTAERGKFDFLFFADTLGARDAADVEAWSHTPKYNSQFEPLTLLSALSVVTEHVGLVSTATTTYNEPFHIARKFASLDYLSGGRAGWNVVTSSSPDEAFNFGFEAHPPHVDRYERAREFVNVVKGLWDTWEDDAFIRDKLTGRYFDPAKFHFLNHDGPHFKVRGPLNISRPVQGYPVIVQAGSSETGKELAAETAEVVFTAQPTLESARAFYGDLKGRVAKYGRSPDHLLIMPGVMPIIGQSRTEANEHFERLQASIHPTVGLSLLADMLGGADLSGYPLDEPLPEQLPETLGNKSRVHTAHRNGAPRQAHGATALYQNRWRPGTLDGRRNGCRYRRPDRRPLSQARRRRIQCHAGRSPRQLGRICASRRPETAGPRIVPPRLRRRARFATIWTYRVHPIQPNLSNDDAPSLADSDWF